MKKNLTILLLIIMVISCNKESGITKQAAPAWLNTMYKVLRDSMPLNDFKTLDLQKIIRIKNDSDKIHFVRIPFSDKKPSEDFVLIALEGEKWKEGKIVHLELTNEKRKETITANGIISISAIDRKQVLQSPIVNGKITALHTNPAARYDLVEPPYEDLEEVVVVGYVSTGGSGISFSTAISLGLFGSGYSLSSGYYAPISYGGGGSTGGYYGSYYDGNASPYYKEYVIEKPIEGRTAVVYEEEPIVIDFETQDVNPAIDLAKYLNCFTKVPDAGATYSIEIMTDIPVDNDPNKLFNVNTGSPGHTFLQIKKTNGATSVLQNIGFYPDQGWKVSITNAPVAGKFVDNGMHEFNASLKMTLNATQFGMVLLEMQRQAGRQYDIDEFNCTDFALNVFNEARTHPLEIPLYQIPGGMTAAGTRTPQGLYNKLQQMKNSADPEAVNIDMGAYKSYAANSNGPCN